MSSVDCMSMHIPRPRSGVSKNDNLIGNSHDYQYFVAAHTCFKLRKRTQNVAPSSSICQIWESGFVIEQLYCLWIRADSWLERVAAKLT